MFFARSIKKLNFFFWISTNAERIVKYKSKIESILCIKNFSSFSISLEFFWCKAYIDCITLIRICLLFNTCKNFIKINKAKEYLSLCKNSNILEQRYYLLAFSFFLCSIRFSAICIAACCVVILFCSA